MPDPVLPDDQGYGEQGADNSTTKGYVAPTPLPAEGGADEDASPPPADAASTAPSKAELEAQMAFDV